jgi:hypothetical protein
MKQKASDRLSELRSALDESLAKKEAAKGEKGEKGESGEKGEKGKGEELGEGGEQAGESGEPGEGESAGNEPGKEGGEAQVSGKYSNANPPLNFGEIRGSSEMEGQFVDKTRKENIRDW